VDSDDDSDDGSDSEDIATGSDSSEYDNDDEISLKNLLDLENSATSNKDPSTSTAQQNSDKDDLINDAAAIAESLQPKGNTLSSTSVVTPIPFLLKHTLREYQVIIAKNTIIVMKM
jgi:E1A-binding protein p400